MSHIPPEPGWDREALGSGPGGLVRDLESELNFLLGVVAFCLLEQKFTRHLELSQAGVQIWFSATCILLALR